MQDTSLQQLAINTLRVHSIEMVDMANSGHPGMPLGAAPLAWHLFSEAMQHSPKNPNWINRDRFVLSAGHASALMYSVLRLFGYDISKEDLQNFRQFDGKTPGHPEIDLTPGIDAGTGPLGQGIAMAVGMAMAEAHLAEKFNRPGHEIVDHYTYVLHGDGCPQEGVSSEACSFAGTQKLDKLIMIYDRNHITIDGNIDITFTEDISKRYEAYGWQVLSSSDANDLDTFAKLIEEAKADKERPTIIIVESKIGYASPVEGQNKAHGAPLGEENTKITKTNLNWPLELEPFVIPESVQNYMDKITEKLEKQEQLWEQKFTEWEKAHPDLAKLWDSYFQPNFSELKNNVELFTIPEKNEATRQSSSKVLNIIGQFMPNFIGGSADLAGSNKTWLNHSDAFNPGNRCGQNINYGIREFAMSCMMNGILLHGGLRSYCATFFTFSDYMRSGIRSSALMNLPALYVFTHDSIGVGEDGPTHQPIEHLTSFRAMPNVLTFRPADYLETVYSYLYALESGRPSIMALSRQGLPQIDLPADRRAVDKGAYIVKDVDSPELILIATGSEVALALAAAETLSKDAIAVRVVSMPCMELFLEQDKDYQDSILPPAITKRIALEAGSSLSWYRFIGDDGKILSIEEFGKSAPANDIFKHFGFTVENVVEMAKTIIG